ncbi:MAG TPA: hypothetical protein VFR02_06725, partial [bacterium]|nr:hypothetical protein [bacterium]
TERFAEPPALPGAADGGESVPKTKWLLPLGLLTLPLWLWLALGLLSPRGQSHGSPDNAPYILAAGVFFLGMGLVLFLIPLISRSGKKGGQKPGGGPPAP